MHIKFGGQSYLFQVPGGEMVLGGCPRPLCFGSGVLLKAGGHVLSGSLKAVCGQDPHPGQHTSFRL